VRREATDGILKVLKEKVPGKQCAELFFESSGRFSKGATEVRSSGTYRLGRVRVVLRKVDRAADEGDELGRQREVER
jgi:hypothetical protein